MVSAPGGFVLQTKISVKYTLPFDLSLNQFFLSVFLGKSVAWPRRRLLRVSVHMHGVGDLRSVRYKPTCLYTISPMVTSHIMQTWSNCNETLGNLSNQNVDVPDVKSGNRNLIFSLSHGALTRQIRTAGVKTKAFRFVVRDRSVPSSEAGYST